MRISNEIISQVRKAESDAKKMDFQERFRNYISNQFKSSKMSYFPTAIGMLQDPVNGFGTTPTRFSLGNKDLKILPIYTDSDEAYFVCFDMNSIVKGDIVKLYVPAGKEGLFVGRGRKHVKRWCRQLSLAGINVVGY